MNTYQGLVTTPVEVTWKEGKNGKKYKISTFNVNIGGTEGRASVFFNDVDASIKNKSVSFAAEESEYRGIPQYKISGDIQIIDDVEEDDGDTFSEDTSGPTSSETTEKKASKRAKTREDYRDLAKASFIADLTTAEEAFAEKGIKATPSHLLEGADSIGRRLTAISLDSKRR